MELCTESILKVIVPVVLILVQIPFFIAFEMKKPKPRDLMPIAVLSVIGALGRAVFAVIPSFNPNSAVVIIAGMQFGPLAGFLTGSLSALASNMLLGQGPWTLWQMTAWGMMGCFAGVFQRTGIFKHRGLLYFVWISLRNIIRMVYEFAVFDRICVSADDRSSYCVLCCKRYL